MPKKYFLITIIVVAVLALGGRIMAETEKIEIYNAKTSKVEKVDPVIKTDQEWRKILTPAQYEVLRHKGTEQAFSQICPVPPRVRKEFINVPAAGPIYLRTKRNSIPGPAGRAFGIQSQN